MLATHLVDTTMPVFLEETIDDAAIIAAACG